MIRSLSKPGREGNFLSLIKDICEKPIADNILNDETECFPLTRQGCPLSQPLFSILLQVLTNATRQEKKDIKIIKVKVKPVPILR